MSLQRNHYEVLGVPRKATTDEVKKKYRELARKFHPDVVQDKTMGQKVFSQINQAYRVLSDPDRRAQYDASLSADATAASAAARAATAAPNGVAPANGVRPQNGVSAQNGVNTRPLDAQQVANIARLVGEAETAFLQNEIGKVKAICETVLKTDPRNQKALGLLGDALDRMGKKQEAAKAYRLALSVTPSFAIKAKLDRLTGVPINGAAPPPIGAAPRVPPIPPGSGAGTAARKPADSPNHTDQGRAEKPAGGLFGRLLGKK